MNPLYAYSIVIIFQPRNLRENNVTIDLFFLELVPVSKLRVK